jgi:hypothetical protein
MRHVTPLSVVPMKILTVAQELTSQGERSLVFQHAVYTRQSIPGTPKKYDIGFMQHLFPV